MPSIAQTEAAKIDWDDLSGMIDLEAEAGPTLSVGRRYGNIRPAYEIGNWDSKRIIPATTVRFEVLEDKPTTYVVRYDNGAVGAFSKTSPFHLGCFAI